MTREEAKELLPIIQAYVEGKTIQQKRQVGYEDEWFDVLFPLWDESPSNYRIKPDVKYRPFNTQEECWQEMQRHQPLGWLKSKKYGRYRCIGELSYSDAFETVCVALSTSESLSRSSDSMFEQYTFDDGTPFGIKEE